MPRTPACLVPIGALPALIGLAGTAYLAASLLLGIVFFGTTVWALGATGKGRERWVFLTSLVYLTGIVIVLVVDRLPLE